MFPADAREAAEIIVVGDDSRVVLHTGEPFLSSASDDGGWIPRPIARAAHKSVRGVVPGPADTNRYIQWDVEGDGLAHLGAYQFLQCLLLP